MFSICRAKPDNYHPVGTGGRSQSYWLVPQLQASDVREEVRQDCYYVAGDSVHALQ